MIGEKGYIVNASTQYKLYLLPAINPNRTGNFAQKIIMTSSNSNAPVKCKKSISIKANSEKCWKVLTDIDNWANWQTDISHAKINGALKPGTTFNWKSGGAKIHSTLFLVEPYKNFGWTGKSFGISAVHTWKITETSEGATIIVEEIMEGFLAGLFKKLLNKKLATGMEKWLELLKRECES